MAKCLISKYKMSLSEAGFWTPEEISAIWDFYVTKSIASSASQKRRASDYGLKEMPFDALLYRSGVPKDKREMLMADSINGVLDEYGFVTREKKGNKEEIEIPIDIDSPRLVCIQPYSIADRGKPAAKAGKAATMFTHIRNSLAHGCTYYFDNGMMLLEDRANGSSGKTTAMMLLPQSAFVDWIKIIDIDAKYYFRNSDRSLYESIDGVRRIKDNDSDGKDGVSARLADSSDRELEDRP